MITVEECLNNKNGNYPLHYACKNGASLDVIKYLVEEADGDKGKEPLGKADNCGNYPLHYACEKGAPLSVIKYLVEEADGDKGKELLGKANNNGSYPLHLACSGGASLDVIKYLVEEADGDKGKELLDKADKYGMYPLHWACQKGAAIDVIKYLVEEADGDKGKELLGKADKYGMYPLHRACWGGASLDVIKCLIQKNPGPLQYKDNNGLTALDLIKTNNAVKEPLLHWVQEFLATKNNQAMSDDPMNDSMDAGERQDRGDDAAMEEDMSIDNEREGGGGRGKRKRVMESSEWAKLPGVEEKDEEMGGDGDGGGGASPARNREIAVEECLKNNWGMEREYQSTIRNETDEVIYVIVTDRTMETVNTNATSATTNIAGNTPGGSAGVTHTNQHNMRPAPPQMTPILPRDFHTFNLESKDYYLSYYTKDFSSGRNVFHEVNLRVQGKDNYTIKSHCLENLVELEPRLAWEIFVLPEPVSVSDMDTTTPPAADGVGQGGSSQRGADSSRGGAGQGVEGQGEGNDTSGNNTNNRGGGDTSGNNNQGDDTSGNNNRGLKRMKHLFGNKCRPTIWNKTDEVVYVYVTDRTIGTVSTTSAKVNPTIAGITPVEFNHSSKHNKGPTPPQMTPIPPHYKEKFNLGSKDYYLTYYTKKQIEESTYSYFHIMNKMLRGKDDYEIHPIYLQFFVERVKVEDTPREIVLGLAINHSYDPMASRESGSSTITSIEVATPERGQLKSPPEDGNTPPPSSS